MEEVSIWDAGENNLSKEELLEIFGSCLLFTNYVSCTYLDFSWLFEIKRNFKIVCMKLSCARNINYYCEISLNVWNYPVPEILIIIVKFHLIKTHLITHMCKKRLGIL
jgi:hypothetical protein